ncbi:putative membrane protein YdfK [bioreactor metagenome]|uniref:Putative membrane protein YdfK n=1 Tax=bioreactor metagenome TaxID=1076179 RepID=A0A644X465_9ZZZZ
MLIGTIVNTATVILGSLIGLSLGNILPERLRDTVMKGLGMCTMFIGITGMLGGKNALITIISIAVGAAAGELLDLDGRLNRFAARLEKKFQKSGGKTSLAEGFVTASLVFCVGTMTIVGALNDGLSGNHEMLFTKAVLDFVSSIIFASSLGIGVLLAAGAVFVIQGSIACLAGLIAPLLQQGNTIEEMTVVGSVLILGLGLNLIGVTKLKVMNYIPAIFLPILLCLFM